MIEKLDKQLDIFIDESGNFDDYSKHNLLYSVAFLVSIEKSKKTT